jgi:hypothetical protein
MRRSTHGDAHARGVAAGVPASRWDSHVVVSLVLARDPPPVARCHRGIARMIFSDTMFLRGCR